MFLTITLVFQLVALILFVVAALGVPTQRFNLVAAGLAFLTASLIW